MTLAQTKPIGNLGVPISLIGKRSRSSSISSTSSTAASSQDGNSIFSQGSQERSSDTSSSCSSPSSDDYKLSPSNLDSGRPSKTLRSDTSSDAGVASLEKLGDKCNLEPRSTEAVTSAASSPAPAAEAGKSLFVDCLVEASVHVLDMIWNAPISKSIEFLNDEQSVTDMTDKDIQRSCRCPIGAPLTGGIPLNLFVRETLRRSRTSCSTLQAALLYCKRIGHQILRSRAELEGVTLSQKDTEALDKLSERHDSVFATKDDSASQGLNPLLCSRRAFLASVMVSSKFLQDRTFSNRAWSKISGLTVQELGLVERRMLESIDFQLAVHDDEWQQWTRYMRGDWKLNFAASACHCNAASAAVETSGDARKGLERTTSAQVPLAPDMEQAVTPASLQLRHGHPTDETMTPTQGAVNDAVQTGPRLPFPMRKGLHVRSISAR